MAAVFIYAYFFLDDGYHLIAQGKLSYNEYYRISFNILCPNLSRFVKR